MLNYIQTRSLVYDVHDKSQFCNFVYRSRVFFEWRMLWILVFGIRNWCGLEPATIFSSITIEV